MKMNKKYFNPTFAVLMAILMSLTISIAMTLLNRGFCTNFLKIFLYQWGFSILIAIPSVFTILPFTRKLMDKIKWE